VEDVQKRLQAWGEGGRKLLENALQFYSDSGNTSWHGASAEIQATWKQLIRILLLAKGEADTENAILNYQCNQLGSTNGETCLMELLPLPSPNTGVWNYNQWSMLSWLRNRHSYFLKILSRREAGLRQKITEHKPQAVIFYGLVLPERKSLLPSWSSIAGGPFDQAFEKEKILLWRKNSETLFIVMRHPVAERDAYFRRIGRWLHDRHKSRFNEK